MPPPGLSFRPAVSLGDCPGSNHQTNVSARPGRTPSSWPERRTRRGRRHDSVLVDVRQAPLWIAAMQAQAGGRALCPHASFVERQPRASSPSSDTERRSGAGGRPAVGTRSSGRSRSSGLRAAKHLIDATHGCPHSLRRATRLVWFVSAHIQFRSDRRDGTFAGVNQAHYLLLATVGRNEGLPLVEYS
jgi:hypothetical protein